MKFSRKIALVLVTGILGASVSMAAPAAADTSWPCPGCKSGPGPKG